MGRRITDPEHLQTFFKYKAAKQAAFCFMCDCKDSRIIEYHHICYETGRITDKWDAVSQMVWLNYPWDDVKDEMQKCITLCRPCHITYHQRLNQNMVERKSGVLIPARIAA